MHIELDLHRRYNCEPNFTKAYNRATCGIDGSLRF